ncbi:MAG: DNA repair and recombination protein RadA [Candidatus Woesearchaeota archaeon]|jgi:DNA repair protein RadA
MKDEDETMVEELNEEQFQFEKEEIDASSVKKKGKEITINDLPGIGPATAEKLTAVGFGTVMAIAVATPGEIVEASGISEAGARKIINAARDNLEMGFESGDQILKKRERVIKLSTGHKGFDTMMGGGFETGAITEIYAEFGGGKTQIGHILAVNALALESEKNPIVFYVDTENTFRPERIRQIAEGKGMDVDTVLKSIKVGRAYNSDHQMLLVDKIEELITEQHLNVKLIVIDSLTAHFRAEFVGRGTLADRQQKLNKHMHALLKLADTHNVCVYVTNQVMAKPDQFFGDPTQAIGGHIVGHASTFRIYLRKGKKGSRVAKLVDSPNLPEAEVAFYLAEKGLQDI